MSVKKEELQAESQRRVAAIAQRLKAFIDSQQLTQSDFANQVEIHPASLSRMIRGEGKVGTGIDKILEIFRAFPALNPMWLLFGEGEMIRTPAGGETAQELEARNEALRGQITVLNIKNEAFEEVIEIVKSNRK